MNGFMAAAIAEAIETLNEGVLPVCSVLVKNAAIHR